MRETLYRTAVDPRMLVFEVTETLLLEDEAHVSATIAELRELGVRFALDDFGTGYSSLSYLHTLPLDMLKIAKSFVDGLSRGGREASFVRMIIELARTLGVGVIAEGIEEPRPGERAAAAWLRPRPGLLSRAAPPGTRRARARAASPERGLAPRSSAAPRSYIR